MSDYLGYVGGTVGAVSLTAVAAASALYIATRPSVFQTPFPLDCQSVPSEVSCLLIYLIMHFFRRPNLVKSVFNFLMLLLA